ncbi:MAG: TonB family protein, partial [Flavitalea sp.]
GPLINSITFSDRTTKNKNGVFSSYHPNGMLESTGDFKNNQKNGTWLYCDTAGKYVSQREFMNGVVTDSIDLTAPKPEPISNDTSKTFTRVERESFFKGGQKDWTKYLTKNLNYHPAAIKANISGRVTVIFIVDKLGKATEARLFQSTHFYLDDEALRLIENSPKWTPAEQDGRIVKSYKLQPIIFRFE